MRQDDEEYQALIPIVYEIVYVAMFQLYKKHRDPGMPDEDPEQYLPRPD